MRGVVKVYKNDELLDVVENTITTIGKNYVLDNWRGRTNVVGLTTAAGYCAVGLGSSSPVVGQSGLDSELPTGSGRLTISGVSRADTGSIVTFATEFSGTSVGTGSLREAALFGTGYDSDESTLLTASSTKDSGVMMCRASFPLHVKGASDRIKVEWTYALW